MPLLDVRDLQKSYRTPEGEVQPVLDIPELVLEAKDQVALEGSSGSGKTTLLNVIAGILSPDRGKVLVAGKDMAVLDEAERDAHRASHLGYVFQSFNLLQGYTALENVLVGMMFGPGMDRAVAEALLDELGLADRKNHRPAQLSIGQQQRVALARALANKPALVLADEPTGNLDHDNGIRVMEIFARLYEAHRTAMVLVTHNPELAAGFDRVLRMEPGGGLVPVTEEAL